MNLEIRPACEPDIENIISACLEEGWTTFGSRRQDFMEVLKGPAFICAYDGEMFAGYARAVSDGHITTFLCELLVVKAYRGKGVGKTLVNHIGGLFPKTRIDLISEADTFYEKIGFTKIGTGYRKRR